MLKFTKMQALGNDFVVIDAVRQQVRLDAGRVRRLADRHFGVGCDQVLVVEPAGSPAVDFRYRIFNGDGEEVEQCGNGARCFVLFARERGLTSKRDLVIETRAGILRPRLEDDGRVTVNMGVPEFEPDRVPFMADGRQDEYDLEVAGGDAVRVRVLALGNPHAVQLVPEVDRAPVNEQGPAIEHHRRFPRRVNAGYAQVLAPDRIRLRVHERGAGETLACGSGACAAVVAGRQAGRLGARVDVEMRGGMLTVCWAGEGEPVLMTGPANFVFDGELDLDAL